MGLLKDARKEILYLLLYVSLTIFGGFFNELFNTKDLIWRRFFNQRGRKKIPVPIFLVPGTLGGRGTLLPLKRRLKKYFRDVFIFKPVRFELVGQERNVQGLNNFIEVKLKLVGESQAIVIGHSQGGIIARRWMNLYDPKGKITLLIVTLGTPQVGSWAPVLVLPFMWWARAMWQLLPPFAKSIDQTASSLKTISIRGQNDPARISWPYEAKATPEILIDGMHLGPIFEGKAFKRIIREIRQRMNQK